MLQSGRSGAGEFTPGSRVNAASLRASIVPLFVNRFYNKRAQLNDSNHRYSITAQVSNQMLQLGWAAEGLVMCANP